MKTFIGGALALVIGVPCLGIFLPALAGLLAGTIPILLILGGGLAVYLGYEDLKADKEAKEDFTEPVSVPGPEEGSTEPDLAGQEEDSRTNPDDDAPRLVGNTDSLVFHKPDCGFAQSAKCTQKFSSPSQAADKGYKPCKICSP
ncbi:Ada metal-binding domain-containing protein [Desulfospira joergensenii]|uniref:Ada metal-binding domain-containing protein n=1 Tax=Desulfospira joergensenii TaxID=53329 RepID=UPI0003B49A8D|nr:Ada metal-binding domain-containing protein [Desulfospira joergensenii]